MKKTTKIILTSIAILVILLFLGYFFRDKILPLFFKPTNLSINEGKKIEDIADKVYLLDNLKAPWDIAFLNQTDYLVTERSGNLKIVFKENVKTFKIDDVYAVGEGGLLGVAIHPNFEKNNYFYLYQTVRTNQGIENRIDRYILKDKNIKKDKVILSGIPGAFTHNGGRIAFGPDNYLYITTGDAQKTQLSQDKNSLAGKILRITAEGGTPEDNPFNNFVYSYGHRNPQGLAWDDDGNLWATEHGSSANDELNLIEKGQNYGWPEITGAQTKEGMRSPVITSGPDETWAPSGLVFVENKLFFAGLRGQALFEVEFTGKKATLKKAHFLRELGRLRQVVEKNGYLYILTSNTDGRGVPQENDDKIIKIKTESIITF